MYFFDRNRNLTCKFSIITENLHVFLVIEILFNPPRDGDFIVHIGSSLIHAKDFFENLLAFTSRIV